MPPAYHGWLAGRERHERAGKSRVADARPDWTLFYGGRFKASYYRIPGEELLDALARMPFADTLE
jgi:hypothetical protein